MDQPQQAPSAMQGMKQGSSMFLAHSIGKHPGTTAIVLAVLVILVIILIVTTVVYRNRWKDLEDKSKFYPSNFHTGSNNPQWWLGAHDAGHGGPMHTGQDVTSGDTRAYGASVAGPHSSAQWLHPGSNGSCPGASGQAVAEAQAAQALQSLHPDDVAGTAMGGYVEQSADKKSARNMTDDQLGAYLYM
jgi:hypothetical protein